MRHLTPILFLCIAALGRGAAAQSPTASPPARPDLGDRADRLWSCVRHDDPGSGTAWAGGRTWKAAFAADGFTYVPFFGSAAPRNYPVRFHDLRATVGGQTVPSAPAARVTREGDTITLDRGPLRERYDLGVESVEQSFVVDTHLPGDVVVEVALTTELREDPAQPGLQFANEFGHVAYGAAFLVRGEARLPIDTAWTGTHLRFTVPAALRGPGPVVIDPVIGTYTLSAGTPGRPEFHPDAAFDVATQQWFVVWENWYSTIDCDVFGERFDVAGAPIPGSATVVDLSTDAWLHPAVANVNAADRFLVVCEARKAGLYGNRSQIWGRTRDAGGGASLSPEFLISDPVAHGPFDHFLPDVGGDPEFATGPRDWCVVWQQQSTGGSALRVRLVDSSGQPGMSQLVSAPGKDLTMPVVSNGNGRGQVVAPGWGYAMAVVDLTTGERDVLIGRIGLDSGIGSSHWLAGPEQDGAPTISSPLAGDQGRTHFLVAFQRQAPASAQALLWTFDPTLGNPVAAGPFDLTQTFGYGSGNVCVESDGIRFAVTASIPGGNLTTGIGTLALGPQDTLVEHEAPVELPGRPAFVRLASSRASGGGPTDYAAAYVDMTYNPTEALLARYRGHGPGWQLVQRPYGCDGMSAQWLGAPLLGQTIQVGLVMGSSNLPGFVMAPLLPTPAPVCGGCTLGVRLDAPILLEAGQPVFWLTIPPDPELVGLTFGLQGFGLGIGSCLGWLSLSDLFEFTIR
ncbi:MAG: hypothetical protein JNL08_02395 [Planctomycetes bacterium]|nr:hypothetical protein [Planctomycetota bacterium]